MLDSITNKPHISLVNHDGGLFFMTRFVRVDVGGWREGNALLHTVLS